MTGDFQTYNDLFGVTGNPGTRRARPAARPAARRRRSPPAFAPSTWPRTSAARSAGQPMPAACSASRPAGGKFPCSAIFPPHPAMRLKNPPDLAVAGPLARSAGDLDLALSVAAGPINARGPAFLKKPRKTEIPGLAPGALARSRISPPVDVEVADAVQRGGDGLSAGGGAGRCRAAGGRFRRGFRNLRLPQFRHRLCRRVQGGAGAHRREGEEVSTPATAAIRPCRRARRNRRRDLLATDGAPRRDHRRLSPLSSRITTPSFARPRPAWRSP